MFGENLLLERSIETSVGGSTIAIRDTVRNDAHGRTPLMMLYHINAGWPLVDAGTRLLLPGAKTTPRDPEPPLGGWTGARVCSGPVARICRAGVLP